MITGSTEQEDITIINIDAPYTRAPKYIRQILMDIKREINSNTIIVRKFNTPLTSMDRSSRQRINKQTMALNDALEQIGLEDITDIYRTCHPKR